MTDYDPTDEEHRLLGSSAISWACNADQRSTLLAESIFVTAGTGTTWLSWDLWRLDKAAS